MLYSIFVTMMIVIVTVSVDVSNQKYCIHCKHFIPYEINDKFGTCKLFPKENSNHYYLVTGQYKLEPIDYSYCITARNTNTMCGINADKYLEKNKTTSFIERLILSRKKQ